MKTIISVLLIICTYTFSFSQIDSIQIEQDSIGVCSDETVYTKAEVMPIFPGCENEGDSTLITMCTMGKIMQHAFENFEYPAVARQHGVTGRVYIRFVVTTTGKIDSYAYSN